MEFALFKPYNPGMSPTPAVPPGPSRLGPNPWLITRALLCWGMVLLSGACRPGEASPARPSKEGQQTNSSAATGARAEDRHFSAMGCSGCHPEHFRQWQETMHAKAHFETVYDYYFMRASQDSSKKLETFCGRCHTPLGVRAGEIPFAHPLQRPGDTKVSPVSSEGVQCDFCHTITGFTRVANSGFTFQPSETKQGPLKHATPRTHKALFSPLFRKAELCGTCHQVVHPGNNIPLETTYSEWKRSPYARAGVVCQDCHMTGGLQPPAGSDKVGSTPRHPGKAATQGQQRAHISRHYFVGPNLIFAQNGRAKKIKALSEALLRRSGRVDIGAVARVGKELQITVRVTNTGAGHNLPTGITELRQLWLEVKVSDPRGRTLLHSGALDQGGAIQPGSVIYRTEVRDAQGRDTTLFWNTVRKGSDRRIPPLSTLIEKYQLQAPASAVKAIIVEAALLYRSVSPAGLAEAGAPKGAVKIPVFTISRAKKRLKL